MWRIIISTDVYVFIVVVVIYDYFINVGVGYGSWIDLLIYVPESTLGFVNHYEKS